MSKYDIIWIGTGQATGTVIPRLAKLDKKVAIIEAGRFGGSCVQLRLHPHKNTRRQRPRRPHGPPGWRFWRRNRQLHHQL